MSLNSSLLIHFMLLSFFLFISNLKSQTVDNRQIISQTFGASLSTQTKTTDAPNKVDDEKQNSEPQAQVEFKEPGGNAGTSSSNTTSPSKSSNTGVRVANKTINTNNIETDDEEEKNRFPNKLKMKNVTTNVDKGVDELANDNEEVQEPLGHNNNNEIIDYNNNNINTNNNNKNIDNKVDDTTKDDLNNKNENDDDSAFTQYTDKSTRGNKTSQNITNQPITSNNQPIASTHQTITSTHKPLSSTHQTITSTHKPLSSTHQTITFTLRSAGTTKLNTKRLHKSLMLSALNNVTTGYVTRPSNEEEGVRDGGKDKDGGVQKDKDGGDGKYNGDNEQKDNGDDGGKGNGDDGGKGNGDDGGRDNGDDGGRDNGDDGGRGKPKAPDDETSDEGFVKTLPTNGSPSKDDEDFESDDFKQEQFKEYKLKEEAQNSRPITLGEDKVLTEERTGGTSGHFMSTLVCIIIFVVLFYLIYHNKNKILAYMIEGKKVRPGRRRGASSVEYSPLANQEDSAQPIAVNDNKNFIF